MGKAKKAAQAKKTPAVKDLAVKDAAAVKGGCDAGSKDPAMIKQMGGATTI